MTIPQTIKNLAVDRDIAGIIPRDFHPIEVVAASSSIATEIARLAGKPEADRHDFLIGVPKYLGALPSDTARALEIIRIDAASVLGISGLAEDQAVLTRANAELVIAQSAVDAAELMQGRRLASIHRLETEIEQANRELESWQIDFDGVIAHNESAIVENFAKHSVDGCFSRIAAMEVLKRLAPTAVSAIKARISTAEKELAGLRAAAPEAKRSRTTVATV